MTKKIEVFASEALPGELEDFPDIKRGWGTTKETTGGIPPMKWFNAIQKRTDEAINNIANNTLGGYSFKEGATLDSWNDFIYDEATKSWYFWTGDYPKVVESGSEPSGVNWISLGDSKSNIFLTGGKIPDGSEVFFDGFYYKSKGETNVNPSSLPSDYPTLINIGMKKYTPYWTADNFSGNDGESIDKAIYAYNKCNLLGRIYLVNKTILIESDTEITGEKGKSEIKWDSQEKPVIDGISGRVGMFDVKENNASYSFKGVSFSSISEIDTYVNVINGFVHSYECVFKKGANYAVFKSSSRISNGTNSIDGEMITESCKIYTKNGVSAYARSSSFYKGNNTKNSVMNCFIDCEMNFDTSVGFGISEFIGNTVIDSLAPYYNMPAYYLDKDDRFSVSDGLVLSRNIAKGTGSLDFKVGDISGHPVKISIVATGDAELLIDGVIASPVSDGFFFSSSESLNSIKINIAGEAKIFYFSVLSLKSQSKMYTAYAGRHIMTGNTFLNVNRALTSGIDTRNITVSDNYVLGGRSFNIDTVSHSPTEGSFKHNISNSLVSNNIFEMCIEPGWVTGSQCKIVGNMFNMCGLFDKYETCILINSENINNDKTTACSVDGNTFSNIKARAVMVTDGYCMIGLNHHDSKVDLGRVSIYQSTSPGVIVLTQSGDYVVNSSDVTINSGFSNYIINFDGDVNIRVPSNKYHNFIGFKGVLVSKSKEQNIKITALSGLGSVNGVNSVTLSGKLIYNIFSLGNSNFIVE